MTNTKVTIHDVFHLTQDVRNDIREIKDALEKNTERITALEFWRAEIMGKIAIVGGVLIVLGNILIDYIKDRFLGRGT